MSNEINLEENSIEDRLTSIEHILKLLLISSVSDSIEKGICDNTPRSDIFFYDKFVVDDKVSSLLKENNLSYHGCLFAFGNQMYFIEVNDDLKPSVVKDIYNNLCDVFRAGEVVLIFKSIIESRKRTLTKSDVRFIVKH